MPLISIIVEIMLGERLRLTFHVMLQLYKIHRSQRSFCVIRGGHANQLDEQREKTMSVAEMTGRRTTPGSHVNLQRGCRNKEAGFRRIGLRSSILVAVNHMNWFAYVPWIAP